MKSRILMAILMVSLFNQSQTQACLPGLTTACQQKSMFSTPQTHCCLANVQRQPSGILAHFKDKPLAQALSWQNLRPVVQQACTSVRNWCCSFIGRWSNTSPKLEPTTAPSGQLSLPASIETPVSAPDLAIPTTACATTSMLSPTAFVALKTVGIVGAVAIAGVATYYGVQWYKRSNVRADLEAKIAAASSLNLPANLQDPNISNEQLTLFSTRLTGAVARVNIVNLEKYPDLQTRRTQFLAGFNLNTKVAQIQTEQDRRQKRTALTQAIQTAEQQATVPENLADANLEELGQALTAAQQTLAAVNLEGYADLNGQRQQAITALQLDQKRARIVTERKRRELAQAIDAAQRQATLPVNLADANLEELGRPLTTAEQTLTAVNLEEHAELAQQRQQAIAALDLAQKRARIATEQKRRELVQATQNMQHQVAALNDLTNADLDAFAAAERGLANLNLEGYADLNTQRQRALAAVQTADNRALIADERARRRARMEREEREIWLKYAGALDQCNQNTLSDWSLWQLYPLQQKINAINPEAETKQLQLRERLLNRKQAALRVLENAIHAHELVASFSSASHTT